MTFYFNRKSGTLNKWGDGFPVTFQNEPPTQGLTGHVLRHGETGDYVCGGPGRMLRMHPTGPPRIYKSHIWAARSLHRFVGLCRHHEFEFLFVIITGKPKMKIYIRTDKMKLYAAGNVAVARGGAPDSVFQEVAFVKTHLPHRVFGYVIRHRDTGTYICGRHQDGAPALRAMEAPRVYSNMDAAHRGLCYFTDRIKEFDIMDVVTAERAICINWEVRMVADDQFYTNGGIERLQDARAAAVASEL